MSNFAFLQQEFFAICDSAKKAESYLNTDARASCWYARMTLEQIVDWLYRSDKNFACYDTSLGARVHDPSFKSNVGEAIFTKSTLIISIGNRAAHAKASKQTDAMQAITELFHVSYWLARTYGHKARPNPSLQFQESLVPRAVKQDAVSLEQLRKQEELIKETTKENEELKLKLKGYDATQQEIEQLRQEVNKAKEENKKLIDTHDYSEEKTRDYFIDVLLEEAGWQVNKPNVTEYEVQGMPNNKGIGYVDYVLWGDDGLPLAVVEAKRTRKDPNVGKQQAVLYANCLEAEFKFKRRPVIYYTNGYEHWFWDDTAHAPRYVQGFHKKDELELLMQRRSSKLSLTTSKINDAIVERSYQHQAIRSVTEAMEKHNQRRSLLVMATGSGKTRTVIALTELLIRCNWAKRILFLADRVSLVNQSSREFSKHLTDVGIVNLLQNADGQGRVYVSTYPTILNLINDTSSDVRKFGIGYFDLVIVDEAHRSIYAKYGAIFSHFDSYLVGLTATPKDEVDHNTYKLFNLEKGVPTFAYGLDEAIKDNYLVPPQAVKVATQFLRKGIKYDELSEEEKQRWDETDWGENGAPDSVDPPALNAWLFNENTVDEVLKYLMLNGEYVASGDRLGKTIIFARNQKHADFICERFDINYPHLKGKFSSVITYDVKYVQSIIDDFYIKEKAPHIAISVDMMDTGIDVPEVVNLVFFKMVHSKTKFWQMVGRGTRLCKDLYGPGKDKKYFKIFDFCDNLRHFNQVITTASSAQPDSLDAKLFKSRLDLINSIDERGLINQNPDENKRENELREFTAKHLHMLVANMTLDNVIVRPKRKQVEKYSDFKNWGKLTLVNVTEIGADLASLPTQIQDTEEEAKRFDLLVLKTQLCVLNGDVGYDKFKQTIQSIASALELQDSIPAIRNQMPLIQNLSTDEWWQDVTVNMLEQMRKSIRLLVKLIEKKERVIVYTDFDDVITGTEDVVVKLGTVGINYEQFRLKTRDFLRLHENKIAVIKLRTNKPITSTDLQELESILLEQAEGNAALIEKAKEVNGGLGLFVRSLLGLERGAAMEAMAEFLNERNSTASQLEFVQMIVDYLTQDGVIDVGRLYEAPFTSVTATGPDSIFDDAKVVRLFNAISDIKLRAVA